MKLRLLFLAALVSAPGAMAQNVFVVLDDGSPRLVKEIRLNRPVIEKDGKRVSSLDDRYALARSTIFRPGLVTLGEFRVKTTHIVTTNGDRYNYDLNISGHLTSDTGFQHCFLVLEMTAWKTNGFAYVELPDLPAGETVTINRTLPLADHLEEGSYRLHLFSDGIEVLHTRFPAAYLAQQKKKTEELLSGKTQDFGPILAHRVNPAYPEALKKAKVAGQARVRVRITTTGDVADPVLVSASDPALGEAALTAVAKWKFDPAVKARHHVAAMIEIPFEFRPPK
jgi:TonB family protein